jgi:hypothetical protein
VKRATAFYISGGCDFLLHSNLFVPHDMYISFDVTWYIIIG